MVHAIQARHHYTTPAQDGPLKFPGKAGARGKGKSQGNGAGAAGADGKETERPTAAPANPSAESGGASDGRATTLKMIQPPGKLPRSLNNRPSGRFC